MDSEFIEAIPVPAFIVDTEDRVTTLNGPANRHFSQLEIGRRFLLAFRQPETASRRFSFRSSLAIHPSRDRFSYPTGVLSSM